jgi:EipB-like
MRLAAVLTPVASLAAAAFLAAAASAGAAPAVTPPPVSIDLASHRAHYTLTLDTAREDVTAATGEMFYEVDDVCDGWATRQRLDMTVTNTDGQPVRMISDYATLENKEGTKMQFHMRQTTDQAVTDQVDGEATLERPGGPGKVHFTSPDDKTIDLAAGTLFPTPHTVAVLTAAEQGKKFLALPLFDGTSADGPQDTFVTILNWNGPEPSRWPALAKLPSGRIRIAFFDQKKASVNTPDYAVGMRYWSNGVSDELSMDFGGFVMKGAIDRFEILPPHKCQ